MINWFWQGKLKKVLLTWLLIISVIPSAITFFIYQNTANNTIAGNVIQHLELFSNEKEQFINYWFTEKQNFIRYLAKSPAIDTADLNRIQDFLEYSIQYSDEYIVLAYVDSKGFIRAGTGGKDVDVRDRPYFNEGVKGRESISDILTGRLSGEPTIIISSPIMKNGKFNGLVVGSVPLSTITKIMESHRIGATGETILIDKQGLMLTESRFTNELIDKGIIKARTALNLELDSPLSQAARQGKPGSGEFIDYRGEKVFAYFHWLPDRQWALIAKQDKKEAMEAGGQKGVRLALATGGSSILLFLILGTLLAGKLADSVKLVAQAAEEIAAGKLDKKIDVNSSYEVRLLAASFNKMSASLSKSYEKLNAYNEEMVAANEELIATNEELSITNLALEKSSMTDQLTGLYNRHFLVDRATREFERALAGNYPISVIVLDIDNFKNVNDTHGHKVGDQVLQQLAEILLEQTRPGDVVARYGGEEFLVMLPNSSLEVGIEVAERLRLKVESNKFKTNNGEINTTISLGVSRFTGESQFAPEELMDKIFIAADLCLYQAKNNGRNQVAGEACGEKNARQER